MGQFALVRKINVNLEKLIAPILTHVPKHNVLQKITGFIFLKTLLLILFFCNKYHQKNNVGHGVNHSLPVLLFLQMKK